MKKKVIVAIGSTIALVSAASTYFAFQLSKTPEALRPIDVKPVTKLLHPEMPSESGKTDQKQIQENAFAIYRHENEFIYLDDVGNPPNKIWVAGDVGVVEANFVEMTNVTQKNCEKELDRPLKKYLLKSDYKILPYVAFGRSDIKLEYLTEGFTVKEFPEDLLKWIQNNFENPHYDTEGESSKYEYDPRKACEYKVNGEELETIKCGQLELLLFNRQSIGTTDGPKHIPFAFAIIGNKRYVMTKFDQDLEEKLGIFPEDNSPAVLINEASFPNCHNEEEADGC